MSEHLLFLQAAGSHFDEAHGLVTAVTEAIRGAHDEEAAGDASLFINRRGSSVTNDFPFRRRGPDPERIAERVERTGYTIHESLLVALAAHATIASPLTEVDLDWIASVAARIGGSDILLETAGVVFAFNAINRIADARRVRLEYRFLRELKPIRGWVERRLASLIGMAYDLSYKHQPRHSPEALLDRLEIVFERLGVPALPDVFHWLSRSPVVLEGIVEMLEANIMSAGVRFDLFKEAAAIGVAARAMPGSGLRRAVDPWVPRESFSDSKTDLVSVCRRYSWQVANAAYTISDEQIRDIYGLGLLDAELLDLTLATALFSGLAIIEPISAAFAPGDAGRHRTHQDLPEPGALAASSGSSEVPMSQP